MGHGCTFDDQFLDEVVQSKDTLENEIVRDDYIQNGVLNVDISFDEIEKVVGKLKTRKATGWDKIPNEVLKNTKVHMLLYYLFNTCFKYNIMPSMWGKAIIKPLPKGADKDPYLPLSYRGISLISCVAIVYTAILNKRIVGYCNQLDIFAEEQNGFRHNRSCEDHIFSLCTIVKNRLNKNKDTFCYL